MSSTEHRFAVSITTTADPTEVIDAVKSAVNTIANRLGHSGLEAFTIEVSTGDGDFVTEYEHDPREFEDD